MRVVVIGGGPGGLFLSGLLRERYPDSRVDLYERNAADETFGFGVVFSRPTLQKLQDGDPEGFAGLFGDAVRWPGIDMVIRGERWRCEGNDFAAIERRRLLGLLIARAQAAGVGLHHGVEVQPGAPELDGADLVVIANGANTQWRRAAATRLGATTATATAKFIWLAATRPFAGMTFLFEENEHGWFAAHSYPYSDDRSTFVVETDERTWRAAGLDAFDAGQPPGPSDDTSRKYLESLFGKHLDGAHLVGNNSRWASFQTVRTQNWLIDDRTVLLGDAAHTAHFSVGSGTKMAMEDALALTVRLGEVIEGETTLPVALQRYEEERRRDVWRIQDLARPSLSWWEHFGEYARLPVAQFTSHFLTRSGRVGIRRLQQADPAYLDRCLSEQFGKDTTTVLDSVVCLPGGDMLSGRIIVLVPSTGTGFDEEAAAGTPQIAGTVEDLGDQHGGPAMMNTFVGDRAVLWLRAPSDVADVEDFVSHLHLPEVVSDTVVLLDATTDPDNGSAGQMAQIRAAEILRIRHHVPVALVLRKTDADEASSLIISGRTDLVAVPAHLVDALLEDERRLVAGVMPRKLGAAAPYLGEDSNA